MASKTRLEKDSLGTQKIPREAYFGIQSARAFENFAISAWKAHPNYLKSIVLIKKAAAKVNTNLKCLSGRKGKIIERVCNEILKGKFSEEFKLDVFQAGAGTSQNMNVNEVIANRANEILGYQKGTYAFIHPNDDVNCSQSTNDVIPTAIRLATLQGIKDFLPILQKLIDSLAKKEREFKKIIKSGRTHLQDATPLFLGQEFSGYTQILRNHHRKIKEASRELWLIGLGGTAVGTGMNSPPLYRKKVAKLLSALSGFPLKPAPNFFEAMQSLGPFCHVSSCAKNLALDLIKISNDLRLLASGPRTGLAEIELPARQAGSSIMPGKLNPVIGEMLSMVCFFVCGLDHSVGLSSQAGHLELNVMLPLLGFALPWTFTLLQNALEAFDSFCIQGIRAHKEKCRFYAENSVAVATVLAPLLGYAKTAEIVKKAIETGESIRKILLAEKIFSAKAIEKLFDLSHLTKPNL